MAFWQVGLFIFHRLPPVIGVLISLFLSLLVGYLPFVGRELTLQRMFVFFPYFILGYYLPVGTFNFFQRGKITKFIGITLWTVLFSIIFKLEKINKYWVFGSKAYEDFMAVPEFGATVRLMVFCLSFLGVFSFFCLISDKKRWYTKYGTKTLTIYLLHGFVVKGLRELIGSTNLPGIILIVTIVIFSFFLTVLLGNDRFSQIAAKGSFLLGNIFQKYMPEKSITPMKRSLIKK
ncbi:hypothetical protein ACWN8V_00540 [Vagococcus elongatus]|uniref:Acyltransferase 3 domain-containing protein n=1 Tax=Vagococcus elongatus TaxID=180344 RepID=A0A430B5J4_9ENTE|nr:hypothetical protein [Vagococcus elongatus]RSU15593.1 hypothetical protein CBF29_00525 [Vagococcus elongatus]